MTIEPNPGGTLAPQPNFGAPGGPIDTDESVVADPDAAAGETPLASPNAGLRAENLALATRLREALLATDAAIAPELVTGETVAEIEASYAAAKAIADRVRESVRRESLAGGIVPAGAPGRSAARPLNARDKIRAGLSRSSGSGG